MGSRADRVPTARNPSGPTAHSLIQDPLSSHAEGGAMDRATPWQVSTHSTEGACQPYPPSREVHPWLAPPWGSGACEKSGESGRKRPEEVE